MFAKDAIFARLNLSDEEYRLYAQMHQPIAAQLREPDLVVRVQADVQTLLARVRRRGVAMERGIDVQYLQRLGDAYAAFFASYDGAPVFVVDTERFDPLDRESDLDQLVRALERFDGRHGALGTPVDIAFD
jgi:deoxyadenosine/deoxycytidine kinase